MSSKIGSGSSPVKQAANETTDTPDIEPVRILRIASDIYPDVMGGVGIHVHEMSKLQAEWGHDVTVYTSDHGDRSKPRHEERDGYQIVRHRELISPLDNSIFPGLASSLIRKAGEYDVIHAHSHLFFSTNLAAAFRQASDTPLVVTNHGLISQTAPKWLQKVFIPTVARFTLESADRVLCYTKTDKARLRERGIDSNVRVIHNGIDCEAFAPRDESNDERELQILFVGRLKPGKGVDDLLTAFVDVVEEFPDVTLKLVGDGPLRDKLIQQAKSDGIYSNVEFVGNVPNDQMPAIYAESDIFALPSLNEGLPRTVLEAMACEVPVIVSDLDNLKSLVKDAGIMIPRQNTAALSTALLKLISDKRFRKRMGKEGRQRVHDDYSWSETVSRTTNMYAMLIN